MYQSPTDVPVCPIPEGDLKSLAEDLDIETKYRLVLTVFEFNGEWIMNKEALATGPEWRPRWNRKLIEGVYQITEDKYEPLRQVIWEKSKYSLLSFERFSSFLENDQASYYIILKR
jgi:hypothetical protein